MATVAQERALQSLIVRVTYSVSRDPERRGGMDVNLPTGIDTTRDSLKSASAAMLQTASILDAAYRLNNPDAGPVYRPATGPADVALVSIMMESPLTVVVALASGGIAALGYGLVAIAERICTFRPRVSRMRKEELVRAADLDRLLDERALGRLEMLKLTLEAEADGIAPERIDFMDPSEVDGEWDLEDFGSTND
jgi:hypothetical protein